MNKPVLSITTGDFETDWCLEVQQLIELRRTKLSQSEIAKQAGVSLKTVQRFENYKSKNIELMYHYKTILK